MLPRRRGIEGCRAACRDRPSTHGPQEGRRWRCCVAEPPGVQCTRQSTQDQAAATPAVAALWPRPPLPSWAPPMAHGTRIPVSRSAPRGPGPPASHGLGRNRHACPVFAACHLSRAARRSAAAAFSCPACWESPGDIRGPQAPTPFPAFSSSFLGVGGPGNH